MGIQSEPTPPEKPELGFVWQSIVRQLDSSPSQDRFISVTDSERSLFHSHPWSLGGGGGSELKALLNETAKQTLGDVATSLGFMAILSEDDAFVAPGLAMARRRIPSRPFVRGEDLRDWDQTVELNVIFPYTVSGSVSPAEIPSDSPEGQHFWKYRTTLRNRTMFGKTPEQHGNKWHSYMQMIAARVLSSRLLSFANVSTYNNFVLARERVIFNAHAPTIAFQLGFSESESLALLGVANSSTACFWMRQTCHNKGRPGAESAGADEPYEHRFEFDNTKLKLLPLPARQHTQLPTLLVQTSTAQQSQTPAATLASWGGPGSGDLRACLARARDEWHLQRRQMIAWQEELDWQIYEAFNLVEPSDAVSQPERQATIPPEGLELGQRAFEIVLARRLADGEVQTTWFERHGSTPTTEVPPHWPAAYRELVERRVRHIAKDANIRLIEQPEYKRRWKTEPWDEQLARALREWLLLRLEVTLATVPLSASAEERRGITPGLTSCAHLADKIRTDGAFMEVATLYRGRPDFDITELVVELVESESVPFLPVLSYNESGLRKRAIWEQVWNFQRREDAIEAEVRGQGAATGGEAHIQTEIKRHQKQEVGDIPVPPKYDGKDFASTTFWRLRGKLDVPKERFIGYPHCNRDADRTPVIGWAGWDHLQQAQAVAGYYERMRTNEGWSDERLLPLLAGVLELLPWLLQWHNALDPQYGMGLGDFFRSFVEEEARRMGKTLDEVRAWQPPATKGGRQRKSRTGNSRTEGRNDT